MIFTDNTKQRIKMTFIFIYTGLRTMLATLLTIFVYQKCSNHDGTYRDCTFKDNFVDLTTFNLISVIINFITLGIFILFYLLEYNRENKCIKYLDIDENIPTNNLKYEISLYPKIEQKLNILNIRYRNFCFGMFGMNILNIVLSSIVVYNYYGGYKSIIGMLSETFLIVDKLYTSINIAYKSVKEILPYSAYMKDYIIFNTIDKKYKLKKTEEIKCIYENKLFKNNNEKENKEIILNYP